MNKCTSLISTLRDKGIESGLFFMAVITAVPRMVRGLSIDEGISGGADDSQGTGQAGDLENVAGSGDSIFQVVANILLFLVGAVSVIMLIIGGFKYVISGGDSTKVESAKNTIIYAIVGIVVAVLAYAAVDFVIESLIEEPETENGGSGSGTDGG